MTQPAIVGSELLYTYEAIDGCKPGAVGQVRLTDGKNDFDDGRMVLHKTSVPLGDCANQKGRLHWAGSSVDAPEPQAEPESEPAVLPEPDAERIETTVAPPKAVKSKPAAKKKAPKKSAGRGRTVTLSE